MPDSTKMSFIDIWLPITTRHYGRPPSFDSPPVDPSLDTHRRVHMPLTTIESYLSVAESYIAHWDLVNTALSRNGPQVGVPGATSLGWLRLRQSCGFPGLFAI